MRRVSAFALILLMAACNKSTPVPLSASTTSTSTFTSTTSTTVDPGTLPQTNEHPRADDPAVQARAQDLFRAIVDGNPAEGMDAFFPLSAYVQVKAIRDPASDWGNRLVGAYVRNIRALHAQLSGAPAEFVSLDIPDRATWVRPGEEYNKIGYWRVYASELRYRVNGQARAFPVFSLISWRGQWYVVHLHSATG